MTAVNPQVSASKPLSRARRKPTSLTGTPEPISHLIHGVLQVVPVGRPGKRAVIYTRISDDRYDDEGGVESQCKDCTRFAAGRDVDVVAYVEDNDRSAMHGARPGYADLVRMVERGELDVIIVKWTDRLYRRLVELHPLTEVLSKAGVPVWSVKSGDVDLSTADGRLRANIMGSVAQHESEIKSERITDAAERRAGHGRFSGGQRRFGYRHRDVRTVYVRKAGGTTEVERPSGPLMLVAEEAEAIKWAYEHVARRGTLESVVRDWQGRGLTGPQGAQFTGVSVRDVLLRPMNAGLVVYKGAELGLAEKLAPGGEAVPAIIDVDTWRTVVAILNDPTRRTTRGRPPVSLLAPVLRCAVCLADPAGPGPYRGRLSAKYRYRRGPVRSRDPIYICRLGHVSRMRPKLDAAVNHEVLHYLLENAPVLRRPVAPTSPTVAAAVREAEKLRGALTGYHAMAAEMEPADYTAAVRSVRAKLAEVETRIVASNGRPATAALVQAEDIPGTWESMTTEDKRTVIKENVAQIVIGRGLPGRTDGTMHDVKVGWREL